MRRTKIVATLGPATSTPEGIAALIDAGVDVFRLNFSHGDHATHEQTFRVVRERAAAAGRPVGILQDLQGPKIRLGEFPGGPVTLRAGDTFSIHSSPHPGDAKGASIDYGKLAKEVGVGQRVLIDDGKVVLSIREILGPTLVCDVVVGGTIAPRKGVNLPDARLSIPALTEKDRRDLAFGLKLGVDFVALSFVQRPEDVAQCCALIAEAGFDTPVIAKIEKPAALSCLDEILNHAWGVMVARGDLGVEMSLEKVPMAQKEIIARATARKRIVITATQMLESMTLSPTPTRAEASDVANAIFDGTDAVMLSGETASGQYPVESVRMMARICVEAENGLLRGGIPRRRDADVSSSRIADAVARAATVTAQLLAAEVIVAFTRSGATAVQVAKTHASQPVAVFTPLQATLQRMTILWGVSPHLLGEVSTVDAMIGAVDEALLQEGLGKMGDRVIIVAGAPISPKGGTNALLVHEIGGV